MGFQVRTNTQPRPFVQPQIAISINLKHVQSSILIPCYFGVVISQEMVGPHDQVSRPNKSECCCVYLCSNISLNPVPTRLMGASLSFNPPSPFLPQSRGHTGIWNTTSKYRTKDHAWNGTNFSCSLGQRNWVHIIQRWLASFMIDMPGFSALGVEACDDKAKNLPPSKGPMDKFCYVCVFLFILLSVSSE